MALQPGRCAEPRVTIPAVGRDNRLGAAPCLASLYSSHFFAGDPDFASGILIASSMGWYLLVSVLILSFAPHDNTGTVGVVLRKRTRNACRSPGFTNLWKSVGKFHFCYRKCPILKWAKENPFSLCPRLF